MTAINEFKFPSIKLIENTTLDVNQLFPRSTEQEMEIFNIYKGPIQM